MYTVEFKAEGRSPVVVHCCTPDNLSKMISFIESHPDVHQFKVMMPGYQIKNLHSHFGWGFCEKFVTKFDW